MLTDKRIFITGGAGFIANALIRHYVDHNQIVVYDNFYRDSLTSSGLADRANVKVIHGDVLDLPLLTASMSGADIVVHAAGIAGIDTVIRDTVKTMQVNMIGTANALQAAQSHQIQDRFISFSTSEIFGNQAFKSTEESVAVSGSVGEARWVYAVSKLAGEHLTQAYHKQYELPVVIVRPFNIYGPGQTGEGAMHVFIKQALQDEDIYIYGDGTAIRAWCYIDDFVNCLFRCIEDPKAVGESFNIGNQRTVITTLGLAQTVCRVLQSKSNIKFRDALSADIELRIPGVNKARDILGFEASIDLEEGIRRTAEYIKSRLQLSVGG